MTETEQYKNQLLLLLCCRYDVPYKDAAEIVKDETHGILDVYTTAEALYFEYLAERVYNN